MEQKLSDTLVKAIDRSNPMMQNLQLASRFNKLVEQGGGESADLEDNKEDKLLCYYADHQDPRGRIVYTDKPATQLHYSTTGDFENSVSPVDEGKHLFIASLATGGYELESIDLIYEDGSRSENLKDKFVAVSN